jgi:hypothetical protein
VAEPNDGVSELSLREKGLGYNANATGQSEIERTRILVSMSTSPKYDEKKLKELIIAYWNDNRLN